MLALEPRILDLISAAQAKRSHWPGAELARLGAESVDIEYSCPTLRRAWGLTCKFTLAYPLPEEARSSVTDIYRALADPTRRIILDELSKREGQTLFELCGRLAMAHHITSSRQAVSQHLAVLEEVGLVRTERDGRTKLHWFDGAPLKTIFSRWPIPQGRTRS